MAENFLMCSTAEWRSEPRQSENAQREDSRIKTDREENQANDGGSSLVHGDQETASEQKSLSR